MPTGSAGVALRWVTVAALIIGTCVERSDAVQTPGSSSILAVNPMAWDPIWQMSYIKARLESEVHWN